MPRTEVPAEVLDSIRNNGVSHAHQHSGAMEGGGMEGRAGRCVFTRVRTCVCGQHSHTAEKLQLSVGFTFR